jgi:aldose sugar dehydrogenase
MLKIVAIAVVAFLLMQAGDARAQAPNLPEVMKDMTRSDEVNALIANAKATIKPGQVILIQRLIHLEPYNANLEFRPGVAPSSLHQHEAELMYVIDGSATLVTGGTLLGVHPGSPGNLAGSGIAGGQSREVGKGDFFIIPENTPHWFSRVDGPLILMSIHMPRGQAAAPSPVPAAVAALLGTRCGTCHDISTVTMARHTPGDWDQTLQNMRSRGAVLSDSELATLRDYLVQVQPATAGVPAAPARALGASMIFPAPRMIPGQPIETRTPEKPDEKPAFAGQTRAPYRASVPFDVTVVTAALRSPWGFAFLPDKKIIVTEKSGDIRVVDSDGTLSDPIKGVPPVLARGQGGLLDIAIDPDFAKTHRIFFTFSEPRGGEMTGVSVGRGILDEQQLALNDVSVIFHSQPSTDTSKSGVSNQGSRIAFDHQGNIFVTIGDRGALSNWPVSNEERAQDLDSDLGKILRITADGQPARDNPFSKKPGALPEIWALGVRDPQGLAINPASGRLWETEHGPQGGDEVNIITAGSNYGWPIIVYGVDYDGSKIGDGITQKAGMEQPIYYWDPAIAPSGMAFYAGNLFPQWRHSLFVGALRGQLLDRLELKGDRVVGEEPLLLGLHSRVRDVRIGPEGAVYAITDNGKLIKLMPQKTVK